MTQLIPVTFTFICLEILLELEKNVTNRGQTPDSTMYRVAAQLIIGDGPTPTACNCFVSGGHWAGRGAVD